MKKAFFFVTLGVLLLLGLLGGGKALQIRDLISAGENMVMPPTAISSEPAIEAQWETTLSSVGGMEAAQGVLITADLAGRISSINFAAGAEVKEGDLLVEQEVSSELTQLEAAQADKALTESSLKRVSRLYRQKLVSRSELDAAQAAFKNAAAREETVMASIGKKQIVAPFSGRLGLRQVDLGQNISAGTPIVSLQAADPMLLNFSLPQHQLQNLTAGLEVRVLTDALPGEQFAGKITAINSEIDASTRSVDIQATLDNSSGALLPGMFATAEVVLPVVQDVLIVPVTAVSYASFGDSVFVVEEKPNETTGEAELVARQQFVQLGEARGDFVSITKGLKAGDVVASAGVFKLRNGATVMINDKNEPEYKLKPELVDQ